jgi:hypothetical protein
MQFTLRDAINHIRANAEFTTENNERVIWLDAKQSEPSKAEIEDAFIALKKLEADKKAAKAALLEKLGITEDEAKLLLS